jgi:ATP-dependent helicase/nuclease subunit A
MATSPNLHLYKASAGSGKTFLLTLKYLGLLLRHPTQYRRVLAVTFTNKATAEMKHRILSELQQLALGNHTPCAQALLAEGQAPDLQTLQATATIVYRTLLHDYGRFSVSTIDTFVQRIVRAFAWEIGLEGNFNLQLQTQVVKTDLIARLYNRINTDPELLSWVVTLAIDRLAEGQNWDFNTDLMNLASELFKERFQSFEEGLAHKTAAQVNTDFAALRQNVYASVDAFNAGWQQLGAAAMQLLSEQDLTPADFYYGKSGFIGYFLKAANGDVASPGERVQNALRPHAKLAADKASQTAKQRIAACTNQLMHYLQQLVGMTDDLCLYHTASLIKKNLDLLRLMRVFAEELRHYRAENNTLLISDTHLLLRQLTADTNAAFIYEKTGNRYQHFLIDEFQDTSGFQWQNFKPLIENSLSEGHYNLMVGDVKQAIYRWRNGDWRLLMRGVKQDLGHLSVQDFTLQQNWRSAEPIVAFNNFLFCAAPQLLQNSLMTDLNDQEVYRSANLSAKSYDTVFSEAYADALQTLPEQAAEAGFVGLQWVDQQATDTGYDALVLEALLQKIVLLLQEGFVPNDFGILTRTNAEARKVVEYLMAATLPPGMALNVVSGDALLLSNNTSIQLLVAALQVMANPKHTVAWAQLRYLHLLLQQAPTHHIEVFATNGSQTALPPAFVQQPEALQRLPLSELVNQLIVLFQLHVYPQHGAYLLAFQDDLLQWTKKGENGIDAFLRYWNDEAGAKALPTKADKASIEVITVHKAKGLAYTVVLMPFIDWNLKPDVYNQPLVWASTAGTPFDQVALLPVRYGKLMRQSLFSEAYFEEQVMSMMDNLNVLYVAFTRARTRIYGWMPTKSQTDHLSHVGDLLLRVAKGHHYAVPDGLPDVRQHFDAEGLIWTYGAEVPPKPAKAAAKAVAFPALVYADWRQQLRLHPGAGITSPTPNLPWQRGVLLHEVLQQLQMPQDLPLVLHQMQVSGLLSLRDKAAFEQELAPLLNLPLFKGWVQGLLLRLGERNVLTTDGQLARPDLVLYNAGQTQIIDFKFTDNPKATPQHLTQVDGYVQQYRAMGFAAVQGYLVYGQQRQVVPVATAPY